ncbi:BapA prefix-like domain-containing protein [Atlantibacter hermannii]|uniref:BapA prefix-like domain-containing protein n=1 Tax=Atlantibacter hermannii TaxID=565 RepID=UPI0028AF1415|nr:BapA prefix-like domain-containing protein [Atlantibacter hermannii]
MALVNTPSGSVDILNRNTGDLVTQFSGAGDRVINITQSSVVRINASPETVNFYERQGDDLIVHMRDGSTVRYQKFFNLMLKGYTASLSSRTSTALIMRCSRFPLKPARPRRKRLFPLWLIPLWVR